METIESRRGRCRLGVALLLVFGAPVLLLALAPDVALTLFAGVLLAALLTGCAEAIAGRTGLGHGAALALVVAALAVAIAAAAWYVAPALADQADALWSSLSGGFGKLRDRLEAYRWGREALEEFEPRELIPAPGDAAGIAAGTVSAALGGLGSAVLLLFTGLYLAVDPGLYRHGLLALLPPERRPRGDAVLGAAGAALRGWLLGKAISMAAVGLLTWAGLRLLGIPLAGVLALLAALFAFIPNLGPILGGAPAVAVALSEGWWSAAAVVGLYVAVQTVESYVLTPVVQMRTVALPPALTLAAQFLLGVLFGGWGVALATPFAAVVVTLFRTLYREDWLGERDGDGEGAR